MFETIETSSIIITLSCASNIRTCVLFWSDNAGRLSHIFTGATPVGATIRTGIITGFVGPSLHVFTTV